GPTPDAGPGPRRGALEGYPSRTRTPGGSSSTRRATARATRNVMGRNESVFEGKNLDDAVRKGLTDLGLTRAEVMITVLEEGSGGFLGFGARPYRVRVVPRPGGAIREPDDRGERRGGRERERDRGRGRD